MNAACHGNFSVSHISHTFHRFISPDIERQNRKCLLTVSIRMFLLSTRFFMKGILLEILKTCAFNELNTQHIDELSTLIRISSFMFSLRPTWYLCYLIDSRWQSLN